MHGVFCSVAETEAFFACGHREETASAVGWCDWTCFQLRGHPGAEPAAVVPDTPDRLLYHKQGPQRQEQVQLLSSCRAV